MKRGIFTKKVAVGLVWAFVIALSMSGCSSGEKDEKSEVNEDVANMAQTIEQKEDDVTSEGIKSDAVIMVVGNTNITYSEVLVYMLMLKQQYEPVFTDEIWSFSVGDDQSFEDMAKDEIINQIARLKIMGFKAASLGVSLNADEKLDIEDDAVEFLQNITMDDQRKYGITQNVVETIYKDNYLAQKVFDVATADVDTQVSDEEARAVKFKQIKLVFNGADKNGNVLEGTDEQKEHARKRMEIIYDNVVTKDKDFDYYANRYSDAANEEKKVLIDETESAVSDAVFGLSDNEYSDVVEGENAYYLLYCTDSNDTSDLEENREKIVKRRQDKVFSELYSNWLHDYDTYIVTGLWNMIRFDEL